MTVNVIPISEDTPVREVVGLLLKYRIRAVLVVIRRRAWRNHRRGNDTFTPILMGWATGRP